MSDITSTTQDTADSSTEPTTERQPVHPDCTRQGAHKRHQWRIQPEWDVDFDDSDFDSAEMARCGGRPFVPAYDLTASRIFRQRIVPNDGGVAEVRFGGTVAEVWIRRGRSGRLSLFAEVEVDETVETTLSLAVVPTGKRVPAGRRVGQSGREHVYLLSQVTGAPSEDGDDLFVADDAASTPVDLDAEVPSV